jgi:hypothetical protein
MKETEIIALERSITDQKSKIISLSGFISSSDDSDVILMELPKKMRASAPAKVGDKLKGYVQILASQAKKRSLDEVAEKEAYLMRTQRYFFTSYFLKYKKFHTMMNVKRSVFSTSRHDERSLMGKEEFKTLRLKAAITAEAIRDLGSRKRTVRLKVLSFA